MLMRKPGRKAVDAEEHQPAKRRSNRGTAEWIKPRANKWHLIQMASLDP